MRILITLAVSFVGLGTTALAGITWSGSIDPQDPTRWTGEITGTAAFVGKADDGTLSVSNGSTLESGFAVIGDEIDSVGRVTIDGMGSEWRAFWVGSSYIGNEGVGEVVITSGGALETSTGHLAKALGSTGTVTVLGDQSRWSSSGRIYVGYDGDGTVNVGDGGKVSDRLGADIGGREGSAGTVTVTGVGSHWESGGAFSIGPGSRNSLLIEAGGRVTSDPGRIYGVATVTGTDSLWTIGLGPGTASNLHVGRHQLSGEHFGGSLLIADGGQVVNGFSYVEGDNGSVVVTGSGSKWTHHRLNIGHGSLRITDGGKVVTGERSWIGSRSPESHSGLTGTLAVTCKDSRWDVGKDLRLFEGTLRVADGGQVTANQLFASQDDLLGDSVIYALSGAVLDADMQFNDAYPTGSSIPFGSGGSLTVKSTAELLGVGHKGHGRLTIADGVSVSSRRGILGYLPGAVGEARVAGERSEWISPSLIVGDGGHGELVVEDDGRLTGGAVTIGVQVSGSLTVKTGGEVSSSAAYLGVDDGSLGVARVSGPTSRWTIDGPLHVGHGFSARDIFGSGTGEVTIHAGGRVATEQGFVGSEFGSEGSVVVAGEESRWSNTGSLHIGGYGSGAITISDGGLVVIGQTLSMHESGWGDAVVNLSDGGMLALLGETDETIDAFLDLIDGTPAIRYRNDYSSEWSPILNATDGVDYRIDSRIAGELAGYTILTVGSRAVPEPTSIWLVAMPIGGSALRRRGSKNRGASVSRLGGIRTSLGRASKSQ